MYVCFRTQMFKCIHAIFHGLGSVRALACMFTDMHVCMYARSCMRTCSGIHANMHISKHAWVCVKFNLKCHTFIVSGYQIFACEILV